MEEKILSFMKKMVLLLFISLFNFPPIVCRGSVFGPYFCYAVHYVLSTFAIILTRKRYGELVALLCLPGAL